MRHACLILVLACLALTAAVAARAQAIGVAAPLTGPSALLGLQMKNGAEAAANARSITVEIADDACTVEGGAAAARQFVAAKVEVVTGFLCTESIEAALPILKDAGIPVIATGVRTDSLTGRKGKTGWPVVRTAPRADAEIQAAANILGRLWRGELFAIIDDGTIYSRELSEGFRIAIEAQSLKPVFIDTFRPQLDNQIGLAGRLRKSGATHVFAAGDRADLAILGRDAAEIGYLVTIAGGEVLRSVSEGVDLADGTLMIGLPEAAEIADPAVVASFRAAGIEPDGYVLPAYASVEVAAQALSVAKSTDAGLLDVLLAEEFQTIFGPIGFDAKGDRTDNPYRLYRYQGGAFIEVD
ncbi:MAG: branched-chain amino acid ABC transporter substrate-binding protein [Mesorhizobium sp.]|nr:branched-chain amino acid ABC transporter substrate-binding protein [Mesorhizobium sp.]